MNNYIFADVSISQYTVHCKFIKLKTRTLHVFQFYFNEGRITKLKELKVDDVYFA